MQQTTNKSSDVNANQVFAPIIIKGQKLATRCEICHQSDLFDPEKNVCTRCKGLQGLLVTANRVATVNTNTTTGASSPSNATSNISFSIIVNGNIAQYLQQPLLVALNPIQLFFGKVDRAVEKRVAKISTPKKLFLALVLCLVGLSGAISTAVHSVKTTFVRASKSTATATATTATATTATTSDINSKGSDANRKLNGVDDLQRNSVKPTSNFNSSISSIINSNSKTNTANTTNALAPDTLAPAGWQPIETLLASTRERRDKAFNDLGLKKKGSYVVAAFSLSCEDCIRLAKELNNLNFATSDKSKFKVTSKSQLNYESDYQLIAVANASEQEISNWQKEHQLNYPIKVISEATMEGLGVALFPSLIKVVKGKVVGVSQVAGVLYE